ncbi:hypothetical protein K2173_010969 [Erythroxylum novogranatense]|uniref:Rieske domain-containing protein n=1 Tax=Erythroxylum novogranatense TaxID=1862640 RepID=A0AAV8T1G3_9ROSI|nr:hypothetical protein K2173_010969 [Erythroxylum novogranatense]
MPVCDLDKRLPHAKRAIGLDIVVWWDRNESTWRVFDDVCPHRLAPLSEGRIDQWGRLQCVYHGWCFGCSGDCKFIPHAPLDDPAKYENFSRSVETRQVEITCMHTYVTFPWHFHVHTFKKACAKTYPSIVQHQVLWFWPKSDTQYKDNFPTKMPPYIPELDDPSYTNSMACRELPFGYEILIENLMDPAHVPYAHYKLVVHIKVDRLDIYGFSTSREGNLNGEFIAPYVYFSAFNLPPAKRNLAEHDSESPSSKRKTKGTSTQVSQRRALVVFLCIPAGPGKSRLIYSFPRNFGVWIDSIIPRWVFHLKQNLVLDSDLYLLHLEERKIMDVGPSNWQKACFLPTKSDAQVLTFRRRLNKYWSHVVNCSSCSKAYKALSALEIVLPLISVGLIGTVAASKQIMSSAPTRPALVLMAVLCFTASRWLAHFIHTSFHFHNYNHSLV